MEAAGAMEVSRERRMRERVVEVLLIFMIAADKET